MNLFAFCKSYLSYLPIIYLQKNLYAFMILLFFVSILEKIKPLLFANTAGILSALKQLN